MPLLRRAPLLLGLSLAACSTDPVSTGGGVEPPTTAITRPAAPAPDMPGRGELVSATAGLRVPRATVGALLLVSGASRAFSARYDAQPYVVRYRTPGVDGQLTTASGAVWFPVGATGALPVVAYMHGTITGKAKAPSNLNLTDEGGVFGGTYASDGSVAVLPDYLGLGVAGAGTFHPYLHLQSEASAAVDLLRAVRALAQQRGATLDRRNLFVTGYSQGGGAAMGLARELERSHAAELPLLGAAPMSGPYDLEGTARAMLEQNADYHAAAVYTAYMVAAFDTVYRLPGPLSELLAPPNDRIAADLVSGVATDQQLAALPSRPQSVTGAAAARAMLADPAHPVWLAARDNNAYDWTPRAPLRMYYGGADRDVLPQNALTAAARMRANGAANVAAVNVGASLDHAGAVLPATIAGKLFLDSLRRTIPAGALASAGVAPRE
jgi:poly(3-hydroxybutyrate) depolymerase